MGERVRMSELLSSIRWGFLFILVDVNLGRFDILPNFVGYFLWLQAFRDYQEKAPELYRLSTFCKIMGVIELVNWLFEPQFLLLSLGTMLISLYLFYTILSWASDYAGQQGYEEAKNLRMLRNMLVIFQVLLFAFVSFLESWSIVIFLLLFIAQLGSFLNLCALVSEEREREGQGSGDIEEGQKE